MYDWTAGTWRLELRDLRELELDRRLPAEDVDEDLELELVLVDLGDGAGEVGEGALLDPDALAHLVLEAGPRLLDLGSTGALDLEEGLDLTARQGRGLGARADEARHARGVADGRPGLVVDIGPHEEVAGEHLLLDDDLLAVLELDDILDRDDHLEDALLLVHRGDAALEVGLHLVLVAGVGVHDVPVAGPVVGALGRALFLLLDVVAALAEDVDHLLGGFVGDGLVDVSGQVG